MKKFIIHIRKYWLSYFILLQPIIDIVAYFQTKIFNNSFSWLIRLILLSLVTLIVFKNSNNKKKLIFQLSPFLIYLFLHLLNLYRIDSLNIFAEIKYYILIFQMPILTILLIDYIKSNTFEINAIKKSMAYNFIIIALSMFLAYITGTYENTYINIGVLGWFTGSNTPSMILCALAPWALYYFSNSNNKVVYFFVSLLVFLTLYVNATKACYITLITSFMVMIFCTIFSKEKKKKIMNLIIPCIFLCASFVLYNFSFTMVNRNSAHNVEMENLEDIKLAINKDDKESKFDNIDFSKINKFDDSEIIEILNTSYIYKDLIEIHGEKAVADEMRDILSASSLSDNRLRKVINAKIIFDDSDIITKNLGIGYSIISEMNLDLENDLTAIYYYYGYIGFAIYIIFVGYFLYKLLCVFLNKKSIIRSKEYVFLVYLILLLLAGGEYSGAFLRKPNANIYLTLLFIITFFNYSYNTSLAKNLKEKKVTILALHLGTGGVEKYISSLSKMIQSDYQIEIIATYKLTEKPVFEFSENIKIKYLIEDKPYKNELVQAIKNKDFKNIFILLFKNLKILLLKQFLNIKAIKNIDSKYVITTREFHNKLVSQYLDDKYVKIATEHNYHNNDKRYIKKVINSCFNIDYLILVSEELRDFYQPRLKNTKCIYIPNVIDKLPKSRNLKKNNALISIGRLSSEKGYSDLIDIISLVKNKLPNIKLFLIGDGTERNNLEVKIKKLKLEKNIILCGFCNSDEIEKYMMKSNIYLMTSFTESFGIVLIEAMSYSLPCIAFDSANGAKNLLSDGIGILIPNRDKELMADKIINLLENFDNLKQIGGNGYNYCKQFLLENVKDEWINLLEKSGE